MTESPVVGAAGDFAGGSAANEPDEVRAVPVAGGELAVARWGGSGPAVVAVHGITSSHLAWAPLARQLPDSVIIAPDLRGRGASAQLPGPWGLARHADDLVAVLDAFDLPQAVLVGHSMGGFVAVVFADRHPERVSRLVLVDGGLPLAVPPGLADDPDAALQAVLGPAITRLSMTFGSVEAYRDFWRAHPALSEWSADLLAYLDYDLGGEPPTLRSRTSAEAVRADYVDLMSGEALRTALANRSRPATFLAAARGMLDESTPLFPVESINEWTGGTPALSAEVISDVNHYSIVLSEAGAAAVAGAVSPAGADGGDVR